MKNKKTLGYIILCVGIVILLFSVLNNMNVNLGPLNFLYYIFSTRIFETIIYSLFEGLGEVLEFILDYFFVVVLLVIGVYFVFFSKDKKEDDDRDEIDLEIERNRYIDDRTIDYGNKRVFRKNADDKKIGGVCSGVAYTLGCDPSIIRIITVLLAIYGSGSIIIIYFVLDMFLKSEHLGK